MNGAIAELWANAINAASRNKVTITGTSHQRLLQKKETNSPAMPKLRAALRMNFIGLVHDCSRYRDASCAVLYVANGGPATSLNTRPLMGRFCPCRFGG